jgi:hypothetical protein
MKRLILSLTIGACLLVPSAGMTLAGQPGTNAGQNCNLTTGPIPGGLTGGAAMAPGSPFNTSPTGGTAGGKYANTFNVPTGGHAPSPNAPVNATSQYDIACAQVP